MEKKKKKKSSVKKKPMKKPRTTGKYTEPADEKMDDWLQEKYDLTKAEHDEFDRKDHAHVRNYGTPKTLDTDKEIDIGILEKIADKRKKPKKKAAKKAVKKSTKKG